MKTPQTEFYQDTAENHRWRLKHGNGKILAAASEGFATKASAKRNFKAVRSAMARALFAFALVFLVACNTTQQRTAYNTIGSVEAIATAGVDGYYTATIKGLASTNGIPPISQAYNHLQLGLQTAAAVAQNGTNALAPGNLLMEGQSLLNLVTSFFPDNKIKTLAKP